MANDDPPITNNWGDFGIGTLGWQALPGGEFWGLLPVGIPEDPDEYKFELQCLINQNNFDQACLASQPPCNAGKNGHPVIWYTSPKGSSPKVWTAFGGPTCVYDEKPKDALDLIAENIQKKFEESPIVAASVVGQPGPNTLLGAHTNFYATAGEQSFDVEMFGQKVHITATPVEYTWAYGDGVVVGPSPYAGGSLPQDRWGEPTNTSHQYGATGDFAVTVTTHFRGAYSVNGGPKLPIANQGHFASVPLPVSVWRSVVKNYADDCIVNPAGAGC